MHATLPVSAAYVLTGHVVHGALPVVALYLPASQAVHEPAGPVDPAAHCTTQGPPAGPAYPLLHVQSESAALPLGELVSLGHTRHAASSVAPVLVEYFPAPQSVHTALEVAPVLVEYLPAPQSVHATLPLVVLYLPAAHAVHVPPFGPVYPMLQVQLESAALPLGELELSRQTMHVVSSVAPVLVEYLPAAQSVHATLPLVVLYLPAAQAVHGPPSGPV